MKRLVFALSLALASQSPARLGETPEECKARYGDPVGATPKDETYAYSKAGMNVGIVFRSGKAAMLVIQKSDQKTPLGSAEILTLLKANGGDLEWLMVEGGEDSKKSWKTPDGKRAANYDHSSSRLVIFQVEAMKKEADKQQQESAKALEGF